MNRAAFQPRRPARPPSLWRRSQRRFMQIGHGCALTFVWFLRIIVVIFAIVTFAIAQNPLGYFAFFAALVLASLVFALARTRLLSFMQFVNRSLVYSALTVSLGILYFIAIAATQTAHWPTDQKGNGIGTVIGVLIAFSLFNPLRTQIQSFIDKRFYRHTYDINKVIADFTSQLHEDVFLDQLNEHLLAVVRETLLPNSVSLWLIHPISQNDQSRWVLAPWTPRQGSEEAEARSETAAQIDTPWTGPRVQSRTEQIVSEEPASPAIATVVDPTQGIECDYEMITSHHLDRSDIIEVKELPLDSPLYQALHESADKLCLPLISWGELVGLLTLGTRLSGQDYTPQDRTLLTTLASHAAPALLVAQLVQERQKRIREHDRIEQELHTARLIQDSLLPEALPRLAGWQLATYYQPASAVGGDFYDFIPLEDGRLGLIIGDATDHGMPAALVMTTTCTMLRTAAQTSSSPGEVLARVNDLLHDRIPSRMFVTCFYAILDPGSGQLRYANAGQDWPFRHSQQGTSELSATGMPLGMLPGVHYEERETTLLPGETLLLYSDGLVEAHNAARDMFGLPHLTELMAGYPATTTLIDYLLSELKRFTGPAWEQEDDVTLVTLQRIAETVPMNQQSEEPELLLDTSIPSIPGNEKQAMEQVAGVVEPLHLPAEKLANLKTAVAEAVMNAMEHGNHYQADKSVFLQVLASEDSVVVRIKDEGEGQPLPERVEEPDLEAKLAGIQNPRGWGLFLIENLVDDLHMTSEDNHHVVELTFYPVSSPGGI